MLFRMSGVLLIHLFLNKQAMNMRKTLLLLVILFAALGAQAADYKILSTSRKYGLFTSYVVEYTSVASDGVTPAQVSGVVTVPLLPSLGNPDVMILDNHHTICDNANAPSVLGGTLACIGAKGVGLGALYAMAAPDYYGYGITRDQVHPYLFQEQNARNSIDIIPVAQDILATKHNLNPKMLYNIGYSQGGGVAMAVHKLLETDDQYSDLKEAFTLGVHTACGDGPYDPVATANDMFSKPEKVEFPALIPLMINGYLSSTPTEGTGGLKFDDVFQPTLLQSTTLVNPNTGETYDYPGLEALIMDKEFSNGKVNSIMTKVCGGKQGLKDFVCEDLINPESDLHKRIFDWMESNNVCIGWQPEGELLLYHLVEDDIVTVENTYIAAKLLNIPDNRVHLYNADDIGIAGEDKHSQFALIFFKDMIDAINNSYNVLEAIEIKFDADAPCYDLQGHQVSVDFHGIVIQRGQKYIK